MALSCAGRQGILLAAVAVMAAGGVPACRRADTTAAPVTTTSSAGTSTAPSSADAKARDHALIRVVDAVGSGTTFDLFAGDLILFDRIAFKTISPYRALDGKRYAFALRPSGMPNAAPLSTNTEDLNDGGYYTAFAIPDDGRGPRLRIVDDDRKVPADGKARLRVVHAGAGVGAVSLHAPGASTTLFDAIDYQSVTEYQDVASTSGALQFSTKGKNEPAATLPNVTFAAGRYYTIVLAGRSPQLEAFVIEDALTP